MSLEMFRESQSKFMENMNSINPIQGMPGFENLQAQQNAFLKAFMSSLSRYNSNESSEKTQMILQAEQKMTLKR